MEKLDYPRLKEILRCGCPFKGTLDSPVSQRLMAAIIAAMDETPESMYTDKELLSYICHGMEDCLISYPAQPIFKQQLKEKLTCWLKVIEMEYQVSLSGCTGYWPEYVSKDRGIKLIKALHKKSPGISKRKLADILGADKRTVQNDLRKLDPRGIYWTGSYSRNRKTIQYLGALDCCPLQ